MIPFSLLYHLISLVHLLVLWGKSRDEGQTHWVDLHNPQFLAVWVDIFKPQKNFNLHNPPRLTRGLKWAEAGLVRGSNFFFLHLFFPHTISTIFRLLCWYLCNIGELHSFFFWTILLIISCFIDYVIVLLIMKFIFYCGHD